MSDIKISKTDNNSVREKYDRQSNPVWSVVWRFLLFCLIIDGGIYFYLYHVEKITLAEGVDRLRHSIHRMVSNASATLHSLSADESPSYNSEKREIVGGNDLNEQSREPLYPRRLSTIEKIYCWEDEKGKVHFSNIGYPVTGNYKILPVE